MPNNDDTAERWHAPTRDATSPRTLWSTNLVTNRNMANFRKQKDTSTLDTIRRSARLGLLNFAQHRALKTRIWMPIRLPSSDESEKARSSGSEYRS